MTASDKRAMIVIDAQASLAEPEGEGPIAFVGALEAFERLKKLVEACRNKNMPVIFIQEVHRPDLVDMGRELDGDEEVHDLEGWQGTELHPELTPLPSRKEYLVKKRRYDAFLGTDLDLVLNGLGVFPGDTLIMAGFITNVCVHYTCAGAHQRDYRIKLVEDCCAGSSRKAHDAVMAQIEYLQHGSVISLDQALEYVKTYNLAH